MATDERGTLVEPGDDEGGDEAAAQGSPEVAQAIDDTKAALAALDQRIAESEDAGALEKDRTALASYLADLERCHRDGERCPPRLDEPAIPSDYDAATCEIGGAFTATVSEWEDRAAELAASACACRTRTCAEWVLAELARWSASLDDGQRDGAAEAETRARECVHRRLSGDT